MISYTLQSAPCLLTVSAISWFGNHPAIERDQKLIAQHLQVNSIESCQAKNKLPAAQVFFVCSLYTRERGADDTH
jgi:hypothetical protein